MSQRLFPLLAYSLPNTLLILYIYNTMSLPNFTAEDFAKWNTTSSCFRLPTSLIAKEAIKDVRVALIEAIGAERVVLSRLCRTTNTVLSLPLPLIK